MCSTAAGRNRGGTFTNSQARLRVIPLGRGTAPARRSALPQTDLHMTRRAPIRLVRLLAVACACLVPAAAAHAAPPVNDLPTSAQDVAPSWTSLTVSQDVLVPASDWGEASTGPEDANPLPSCTGAIGFKSMWYTVVGARGGRAARVGHLDRHREIPARRDRARPVAMMRSPAVSWPSARLVPRPPRRRTSLPASRRQPRPISFASLRSRCSRPRAGLPTLTVRFAGRDVTPPHIFVSSPLHAFNRQPADPSTTRIDLVATRPPASIRRPRTGSSTTG